LGTDEPDFRGFVQLVPTEWISFRRLIKGGRATALTADQTDWADSGNAQLQKDPYRSFSIFG
jgi:hypothetical protein